MHNEYRNAECYHTVCQNMIHFAHSLLMNVVVIFQNVVMLSVVGCQGIQHNDIQHNDTQHKGLICDTQHKGH
jgi:hypothetical protein